MEVKQQPKGKDKPKPKLKSGQMPDHSPFKKKNVGTIRPFGARSR